MSVGDQNLQKKERVKIGEVRNIKPTTFVLVRPDVEWGMAELRKNPRLDLSICPWVAKVTREPDLVPIPVGTQASAAERIDQGQICTRHGNHGCW